MKEFFLNQNNHFEIKLFSIYHIFLIILTVIFILLIVHNKNKIKNMSQKNKKYIRWVIGSIVLLNFILRRGSFLFYGVYYWRNHLDINFCNFTSIIFLIYCISGNKKVINLCYYFAFIGPLLSILIPSVNIDPTNYSFYSFVILHHLVLVFTIFFIYAEDINYNKMTFFNAVLFLIIYLCVINIFNLIFSTEYNMPISFINSSIQDTKIMKFIFNYHIDYLVMIIIIFLMLYLSRFILKIINRKN